jgi:4-hydroxy-3-methylbut-2-enyl diphosphate reductase
MNLAFTALKAETGPVYSVGPLVHNQAAFDLLEKKGLSLYEEGAELKDGAVVIIRAHGLPPEKELSLREGSATIVDATCPKVAAVQRLVKREAEAGRSIIIWGTARHPEVEGLLGYSQGKGIAIDGIDDLDALPNYEKVLLVAQTTQDIAKWEALKQRAEEKYQDADILSVLTICKATVDRQQEALELSQKSDAVVVVGGKESGNTRRLYNIVSSSGKKAIAVEGPEDIPPGFAEGLERVGLIAGASTPNWQIRVVGQALSASGRDLEKTPGAFFRRLFRALVLSNTYVGLGAGVYGWALSKAMGFELPGVYFGLYVYFALANHLLHGFMDRASSRFNDPDRAAFLLKYQEPLIALGLFCLFFSLTAAWLVGTRSLICILVFSLMGLYFSLPETVKALRGRVILRLRDIPFTKTINVALGWAVLLTIPVMLHVPPLVPLTKAGLLVMGAGFVAVWFQVFSRNFLMDMLDAKGDRVFERQTPASILGYRRAPVFLIGHIVIWTLFLTLSYTLGILTPVALLFILSGPVHNGLILHRLMTRPDLGGFHFDLLVDGQFFLAGLLALLWTLF